MLLWVTCGGASLGLTGCVFSLQEPDQVYEGITFEDFLKVGVQEVGGEAQGAGGSG